MTTTADPSRQASQLAHPDCIYVNGEWTQPSTAGQIVVLDSYTEEPFVTVAAAATADIDVAVDAARHAFDQGPWPRLSYCERAEYLRRLADGLAERQAEVAQFWAAETGSTFAVAYPFAGSVSAVYRYYADLAETFPFERRFDNPPGGGAVALLTSEPVGVVGAIVPWNAPINIMAYNIAPALLAGCTLVLKVSPEAPSSGYLMAEIADSIGLPPGVLNMVAAERGPSERLVENPRVDKIAFTGSLAAGKKIGAVMAERIGRVTLELGGKSAAVVLDDVDLKEAAQAIARYSCFLTGQVCSALTRIIVPRERHDELAKHLVQAMRSFKIGDPLDPGVSIGPVASKVQLERIEGLVQAAIDEGQELATGGKRPDGHETGYFYEPTLFVNVDNQSSISQDEVFGPVLVLIPADDEEHAIELANDTIYGLNNSVFTNDIDKAYQVARRLRSGTVGSNVFRSDMMIGFGGFKQSGVGREGGEDGLRSFLETKTIVLDGLPSHIQ